MEKKTPGLSLSEAIDILIDETRPSFAREGPFLRFKAIIYASLLCMGRHTITGLLSASGQQFEDWSAAYRLFERGRIHPDALFAVVRKHAVESLPPDGPIVVMMDDTLIRKRGLLVSGASWRKDPLGPHFSCNFVWAQRFLQVSIAIPDTDDPCSRARGIPIDLLHCPTAKKPKPSASSEEWEAYRAHAEQARISVQGVARVRALRAAFDAESKKQQLIVCADGQYTNKTVISGLPDRTTLIGRIRKDANLCEPPPPVDTTNEGRRGRKLVYGKPLPTPEELRRDPSIPTQRVSVFAAGRTFEIDVKAIGPVRWRQGAGGRDLKLVIIPPLGYRRNKTSRILYRNPGYIISTDPNLDATTIVQKYLWRWEIENNFRDEKTLLGAGQAQMRTKPAVEIAPAVSVAAYAFLHLADRMTTANDHRPPRPKWQRRQSHRLERTTTQGLIRDLRSELWAKQLDVEHFSGFAMAESEGTTQEKIGKWAPSAVVYASN